VLTCGALLLAGCGGSGETDGAPSDSAASAATSGGGSAALSAEQMEKGIGPIREVTLGAIDPALAERGEDVFRTKCFACHRLDERYVAPRLGDVLDHRQPEYVMNMMLNPSEMVARHPTVRALLAEFMVEMPNQGLTEDEARAVLEYIRHESAEAGSGGGKRDGTGDGHT
jgi:mono/diheme cytochrome c family protein